MAKSRVAVISEIPTPYRDPLFARLARQGGFNLTVLFCASTERGRDWVTDRPRPYDHSVLRGIQLPLGGGSPISFKLNPGIWSALRAGSYDVVVLGGYAQPTMQLALWWCFGNGVPYAIMWESHALSPRTAWRRLTQRVLAGHWVRRASALLPAGSAAADLLVELGADRKRMFYMPNTPPAEEWISSTDRLRSRRDDIRTSMGIEQEAVVLYVGRLIPSKQPAVLLDAFAGLRQEQASVALILAGSGPLEPALRRQVREERIRNVHFTGPVGYQRVRELYAAADIFALPSSFESWGTVVNEALLAGLPVVTTPWVGSARDLVIPGRTGVVVPDRDSAALRDALLDLLLDEQLRRGMGQAGRELARAWADDLCVESFMSALSLSLAGRDRQLGANMQ